MIGFSGTNDDLYFEYDESGNIIEERHYNGSTFLFKIVYSYNEDNEIISQVTHLNDD